MPIFMTIDGSKSTYVKAVPCETVFGALVQTSQSLADQLTMNGPWFCPELDEYTILNKGEKTILAKIQTCTDAQNNLGDKADPSIVC